MPRIIHPPAGTLNLAQPVFGVPALVEGESAAPPILGYVTPAVLMDSVVKQAVSGKDLGDL